MAAFTECISPFLDEAAIGHKPLAIVINVFSVVAATWPAASELLPNAS